jgi:hypothetical protein
MTTSDTDFRMCGDTPTSSQLVVLDLNSLANLCSWWQRRLGLSHWEICLKIVRGPTLDDGSMADVSWNLVKHQAMLRVIDPNDYPAFIPTHDAWPQDMERSLVHELLHLVFATFDAPENTPEDSAQEQTIAALSKALVTLRREAYPYLLDQLHHVGGLQL